MPLSRSLTREEQQRNNDRHRPEVVAAVLLVLLLYAYLSTHIAEDVGLPPPQDLAETGGVTIDHVFDEDRNVDSAIVVHYTELHDNDDERLILFLTIAVAFLLAYYLPLSLKVPALVLAFVAGVLFLFGVPVTSTLVLGHLIVYATFHPRGVARQQALLLPLLGGLIFCSFFVGGDRPPLASLAIVVLGSLLCAALYRFALMPLLARRRAGGVLRMLVVQAPFVTVIAGALAHGLAGAKWSLPVGVLLLFWQWQRLMVYRVDCKDGRVPDDLSFVRYLSVFLSPAIITNWTWGQYVGQAYSYLTASFLCEEKNRIVLSGLRLWGVSLSFLVFGNWVLQTLPVAAASLGIKVYPVTSTLVYEFVNGADVGTATVLLSTLVDLLDVYLIYGCVLHFKVGAWRVFGYRVDPQYNKPWMATNLVTLWSRYAFHFREFLVTTFFYPVFFRNTKRHTVARIVLATLAAATFGNLVWGHIPDKLLLDGIRMEHLVWVLRTWPYFVLLGLGITFTELYLLRKKRTRRPWARDRWLWTDVAAAYLSIQYFALIHIFARPTEGGTLWDATRLFLRGFGLYL